MSDIGWSLHIWLRSICWITWEAIFFVQIIFYKQILRKKNLTFHLYFTDRKCEWRCWFVTLQQFVIIRKDECLTLVSFGNFLIDGDYCFNLFQQKLTLTHLLKWTIQSLKWTMREFGMKMLKMSLQSDLITIRQNFFFCYSFQTLKSQTENFLISQWDYPSVNYWFDKFFIWSKIHYNSNLNLLIL